METNSEKAVIQEFSLEQSFKNEELDYSIAENHAASLRHLESMCRQCFWIFDYHRNNFYYISANTDFFPQKDMELVRQNGYDYFIRNTHPNDILYLLTIHKTAWKFLKNLPKNQSVTDFKISYIIRLRNTAGKYVPVSQQVKLIETDEYGNLWLSMGLFEEVNSQLSYFPYIQNTITGEKTDLNEIERAKHSFNAPKLSEREISLLGYLSKSFTQQEIANLMHISIDTLKGHRKNLYRKLHAADKNEALKNAYYLGINTDF